MEFENAADAVPRFSESGLSEDFVFDSNEILSLPADIQSESQLLTCAVLKNMEPLDASMTAYGAALLIQSVLSRNIPLSSRRLAPSVVAEEQDKFLAAFSHHAISVLSSTTWRKAMEERGALCDVADLLDGHLVSQIKHKVDTAKELPLSSRSAADLVLLAKSLSLSLPKITETSASVDAIKGVSTRSNADLLPFSNEVFDIHMSSIHVDVDSKEQVPRPETSRTFRELTHWHNTRPTTMQGKVSLTDWQKARALRSHQMFLSKPDFFPPPLVYDADHPLQGSFSNTLPVSPIRLAKRSSLR